MRIFRIPSRRLRSAVTVCCMLLLACGCYGLTADRAVLAENDQTAMLERGIDLPIIMYHSFLKDTNRSGDYVVTPDQLEADIRYLQANGYSFILTQDLIDYVYNDIPLPDKPVMLTFDDGYYNNYYYAWDILKKYNAKAIISPIVIESEKFSDNPDENPNYGHCSWDDLKAMSDSKLVEIANHSYNFHKYADRKGAKIKSGESYDSYKEVFLADTAKAESLIGENVGVQMLAYTYPFGSFCSESEELLKERGYRVTYITVDKNNTITKDPDCLYELARYNRPADISTEEFMQKIVP